MINVEKVRKWSTRLECNVKMDSLPFPYLIVGEEEGGSYQQPPCFPGYIPPRMGGQITLTVSGKGVLRVGEKNFICTPGTAFCYRFCDSSVSYSTTQTDRWGFLWVAFSGRASERMIADINSNFGYFFTLGVNSPLEKTLLEYRRYANSANYISPFDGARIALLMFELLCSPPGARLPNAQQMIHDVDELMYESFMQPFSGKSLAREIGVSREHLSRTFHKATGKTLRAHCEEHQLQEAMALLLKSTLGCKEIAMICNYGSYTAFFRSFKRKYGISPKKFRKNSAM